jgi:hypothetical protein
MKITQIERYTYYLFGSRDEGEAIIFLYDDKSTVAGEVVFCDDADPLPASAEKHGRQLLYFRRSALHDVVDLLRNEGPIFLKEDNGTVALSTGFEPVGEGEQLPPLRTLVQRHPG